MLSSEAELQRAIQNNASMPKPKLINVEEAACWFVVKFRLAAQSLETGVRIKRIRNKLALRVIQFLDK